MSLTSQFLNGPQKFNSFKNWFQSIALSIWIDVKHDFTWTTAIKLFYKLRWVDSKQLDFQFINSRIIALLHWILNALAFPFDCHLLNSKCKIIKIKIKKVQFFHLRVNILKIILALRTLQKQLRKNILLNSERAQDPIFDQLASFHPLNWHEDWFGHSCFQFILAIGLNLKTQQSRKTIKIWRLD